MNRYTRTSNLVLLLAILIVVGNTLLINVAARTETNRLSSTDVVIHKNHQEQQHSNTIIHSRRKTETELPIRLRRVRQFDNNPTTTQKYYNRNFNAFPSTHRTVKNLPDNNNNNNPHSISSHDNWSAFGGSRPGIVRAGRDYYRPIFHHQQSSDSDSSGIDRAVETFHSNNNNHNNNNGDNSGDFWPNSRHPNFTPVTTTTTTTTEKPNVYEDDISPKNNTHICPQHKTVLVPVKSYEIYSRPVYRHITEPCKINKYCTRVQLVNYEPSYRDVIKQKHTRQVTYECCPGWSRITKESTDCMKPLCRMKCKNGGKCSMPDTCECLAGFSGRFCESDINECKENKPCDQLCYNTEGSYYCKCRDGFVLHTDRQSCKKIGDDENIAFEARDLENEIDIENVPNSNDVSLVSSRVQHIEKILENERVKTHELEKNLQTTYYTVNSLKSRLSTLENMQQPLKESLLAYGSKTKKLENLINLLIKCRKIPQSSFCP